MTEPAEKQTKKAPAPYKGGGPLRYALAVQVMDKMAPLGSDQVRSVLETIYDFVTNTPDPPDGEGEFSVEEHHPEEIPRGSIPRNGYL